MHPVMFKFFLLGQDIVIGTYGVMMVAALATGVCLSLVIARRYGYQAGNFINYCLLIVAGIIGGALLTGFIIFLPERIGRKFIDYPSALVSWGGILGGLAALILINFKWKENFLLLADIFTPGYLVGMGIGRIGCFFAGCCYGVHTASCIGITFSDPVAPASLMHQPLVPTQLISAAFLMSAGLVFIPIVLRRKNTGFGFGSSVIVFSIFRFLIEFWRDDPRVFVLGMSDGQVFSILYFMAGVATIIYVIRKTSPPGPPSAFRTSCPRSALQHPVGSLSHRRGGEDVWI